MPVLTLNGVSKAYGRQLAANDVSFSVPEGSVFGLLGPNGAGKTTTIRMITGITGPDRGAITMFNEEQRPEHQNKVGYMPEERGLYKKLPVRAQLEYFGALKGLSKSHLTERVDFWLDKFEVRDWEKKKTSELSKGMQQKLQFIVTVLHDPELLILDEPLSGLDPINAEIINDAILDLRKQGKTIILSTHRMEQVEQLCEEIVLINKGKIVLAGKVRDLKRVSGRTLISLGYFGPSNFLAAFSGSRVDIREDNPNEMLLELQPGADPAELLRYASERVEVRKWELVEPSIKELFLKAVAGSGGVDGMNELKKSI